VDELTRLFLAARDGDRTALLHAIRTSQADVWRLAYHLVGPDDADDVTQDTFVRAWKALPAFRGDSSARTWLLSITRRACADQVRRTVRQIVLRQETCNGNRETLRSTFFSRDGIVHWHFGSFKRKQTRMRAWHAEFPAAYSPRMGFPSSSSTRPPVSVTSPALVPRSLGVTGMA